MTAVCDASPLIGLTAIGELDLLPRLFGSVLIPEAISRELTADLDRPGARELAAAPWLKVSPISDFRLAASFLLLQLDEGESEVLTLAAEHQAEVVVIDERKARRVALLHGFETIGVLGILTIARRRGWIGPVQPLLDRLQHQAGFRFSRVLRQQTLKAVGEPLDP